MDYKIFVGLEEPPLLNNKIEGEYLDDIINMCSKHLNLSKNDVLYSKITKSVKDRPISDCRKLISYYIIQMKLPSKLLERTYPEARGLDHSSILGNSKTVKGFLDIKEPQFIKYIEQINEKYRIL